MSERLLVKMEKTAKNLGSIIKKQYQLTELRICELEAAAGELLRYAKDLGQNELALYELLPLVSEELLEQEPRISTPSDNLPENEKRLSYAAHMTDILDKAFLSELFCERASEYGVSVSESELLESTAGECSFVYVKNAYSDEAYDVLTENIKDARLKYVNTPREAAISVAEGGATYCILPFEEHSVRIASVSELIASYDLKINSITSVLGFDGTADMKYAMLSRFFAVPSKEEFDDRYLEIRHPASSAPELSDIILAASAYGHEIYRVNTCRTMEDGEPKLYYSLVFRDDERDFSAMLVYLSLFSPETVIVGMYKNLE